MSKTKWMPGPYQIEHVKYFADLPGLQSGTYEISTPFVGEWLGQAQTLGQAQLFAAAPELYAFLERCMTGLRNLVEFGLIPASHFPDTLREADEIAALLAKARGEKA